MISMDVHDMRYIYMIMVIYESNLLFLSTYIILTQTFCDYFYTEIKIAVYTSETSIYVERDFPISCLKYPFKLYYTPMPPTSV